MATIEDLHPVRIDVRPASVIQGPPDAYKNQSNPRGSLFISNWNKFHNDIQEERRGSKKDIKNLLELFTQIGYDGRTVVVEDLTKQQLFDVLKRFRDEDIHSSVDSLVAVFMSHGVTDYTFVASDGEEIHVQDIYRMFNNDECPALKGKPKIFIFQFCRGSEQSGGNLGALDIDGKNLGLESLGQPEVKLSEVRLCFSTLAGYVSYRDPIHGSVYIQHLCSVLMEWAKDMNMADLILKINAQLQTTSYQQLCDYHVLGCTRRFFFNPVGNRRNYKSSTSQESQKLSLGNGSTGLAAPSSDTSTITSLGMMVRFPSGKVAAFLRKVPSTSKAIGADIWPILPWMFWAIFGAMALVFLFCIASVYLNTERLSLSNTKTSSTDYHLPERTMGHACDTYSDRKGVPESTTKIMESSNEMASAHLSTKPSSMSNQLSRQSENGVSNTNSYGRRKTEQSRSTNTAHNGKMDHSSLNTIEKASTHLTTNPSSMSNQPSKQSESRISSSNSYGRRKTEQSRSKNTAHNGKMDHSSSNTKVSSTDFSSAALGMGSADDPYSDRKGGTGYKTMISETLNKIASVLLHTHPSVMSEVQSHVAPVAAFTTPAAFIENFRGRAVDTYFDRKEVPGFITMFMEPSSEMASAHLSTKPSSMSNQPSKQSESRVKSSNSYGGRKTEQSRSKNTAHNCKVDHSSLNTIEKASAHLSTNPSSMSNQPSKQSESRLKSSNSYGRPKTEQALSKNTAHNGKMDHPVLGPSDSTLWASFGAMDLEMPCFGAMALAMLCFGAMALAMLCFGAMALVKLCFMCLKLFGKLASTVLREKSSSGINQSSGEKKSHKDDTYPHEHRGTVFLVNNIEGCKRDVFQIQRVFTDLGYKAVIVRNTTSSQTLIEFLHQPESKVNGPLVIVFFGYGYGDYLFTEQSGRESFSFKAFCEKFNYARGDGYPSVVFTNTCLRARTSHTVVHNRLQTPLHDTFHFCTKIKGTCEGGSLFTKAVLREIEETGPSHEFSTFVENITRRMEESLENKNADQYLTDVRYYGVTKKLFFPHH